MVPRQHFILYMIIFAAPHGIIAESSECTFSNYSLLCARRGLVNIPHVKESILLLNFSDNRLNVLFNNTFYDYPHLETLYLQGNIIENVEHGTFSSLHRLEQVDLSENYIPFIHPGTFIHNRKLKTVKLQGNPLLRVDFSVPFLNAPSLVNLDLSYCGISYLSEKSFSKLNSLRMLDLSGNNLQVMSVKALNYLPNIKVVNLGNNRWTCDCTLSMLLEWVRNIRPNDETYHPRVHCYVVNTSLERRERRTILPGEHKYCDSNGSSNVAPEVSVPKFVDEALTSSLSLIRNTETLLPISLEVGSTEYVSDTQSLHELRNASFAWQISDILTGSSVILMVIMTVVLAFGLIFCLRRFYYKPYTTSDDFDQEFYGGKQNLISQQHLISISGSDHTYEYIN